MPRSKKCLRCGKDCGSELYCYLCRAGYPPTYAESKREKEWFKRTWKRIEKIGRMFLNPSRRDNK